MATIPTDATLVAAFAAGSREAGDALFARHAPALRRFLGTRCRDPELAAELLQEVAARLVAAAPRLDPGRNTQAYLFRVAQNVWRDHLRREILRRRAADHLMREGSVAPRAADERVLERELATAVRRAIRSLPEAQREVLELRHREAITFRQIAERLRRPLGTVLSQMRAALEKIGAEVEDYR